MKRVAIFYWTLVFIGGLFVIAVKAGVPLSSEVQKTAGPITTTIPVVTQFSGSGIETLIAGTGSQNVAYVITNEDSTNGIRCEYGTTTGTAPVTTPTSTVGRLFLPNTTFVELVAPNNRLDCIPTAGSPKISVTAYLR